MINFWISQRENLNIINEKDFEDLEDEQPTVVVLNPGDLTAEEASKIKEDLTKGNYLFKQYTKLRSNYFIYVRLNCYV